MADTNCCWCLEVGIYLLFISFISPYPGRILPALAQGSSELHLLCQIWERSERLETKTNQMSWSQSILKCTKTLFLPCQTLVESPELPGNAEGRWLCMVGSPLLSPTALPSPPASPPVHSSTSLPPGKLSGGKTGDRCCVNLCSINFDSDSRPLGSSAEHGRVGARSCSAVPAGLGCAAHTASTPVSPSQAAGQCPGCHSNSHRLSLRWGS